MAEVPERAKTRTQLVEEAIQAALDAEWSRALELNQEIRERFGADEEVNNRLGKAQTELGKLDDALGNYRATLELNPLNVIALKNVNRLEALMEEKAKPVAAAAVDPNLFVEEMGKTALADVKLDKKVDPAIIAAGDQLELIATGDQLQVKTAAGVTVGYVETKLARRVLKFIAGGNKYTAAVATVEDGSLRVIIRETYQAPEFAGVPSFPVQKASEFRAYAKDSLLRETEIEGLDEEDDGELGGMDLDDELEGMHAVDPSLEDAADFGDEASQEEF